MCLIGREEGKVVATMGDGRTKPGYHIPEPGHREVGAHEKGTKPDGQSDGHNVLNRVGINGDDTGWSRPLMMNLVTMFVEFWMVKKPEGTQKFMKYFIKGSPSHGNEAALPSMEPIIVYVL